MTLPALHLSCFVAYGRVALLHRASSLSRYHLSAGRFPLHSVVSSWCTLISRQLNTRTTKTCSHYQRLDCKTCSTISLIQHCHWACDWHHRSASSYAFIAQVQLPQIKFGEHIIPWKSSVMCIWAVGLPRMEGHLLH